MENHSLIQNNLIFEDNKNKMFLSKMLNFEHYVGYISDIWKKNVYWGLLLNLYSLFLLFIPQDFRMYEKQHFISPIKLICVLYWTQKYITEWSFLTNIFINTFKHLQTPNSQI